MDSDTLRQKTTTIRKSLNASNPLWDSVGSAANQAVFDLLLAIVALAGEEEIDHVESEPVDKSDGWSASVTAYTSTKVIRASAEWRSDGSHDPAKADCFSRAKIRGITLDRIEGPTGWASEDWPSSAMFTVDYGDAGRVTFGHASYPAPAKASAFLPSLLRDLETSQRP